MHQRVCVGYYLLAFGHTEWPVWELALHQMTMFCYRGTAWPCRLQGVPHHQLCRLGPGPSGGTGDVGSRFGQGRGTVGAAGWSGGLRVTLWSRASKERGREKEEAGSFVGGWCLPSRCREMEGAWGQDLVGDAGLGKNPGWSREPQTFWNAFFKKKGSWEREQQ